MSALIICNVSALRAIRWARQRYDVVPWEPVGRVEIRHALDDGVPNRDRIDWDVLRRYGFVGDEGADGGEPLHVLVGRDEDRRSREELCCHVQRRDLERGMLLRVEPGIYCASPALAAMQYARGRDLSEVFSLVMELLGSYTLPAEPTFGLARGEAWRARPGFLAPDNARQDGDEPVEQAHYRCAPATTLLELRRVIRLSASSNDRSMRTAVGLAMPGSASPGETIMAAMLGLPMRYGGFGCDQLPRGGMRLNHRIEFSGQAVNMSSGMPWAVCDAYIEAAKTDLEYNGIGHEQVNARIHDGNRNNGLRGMGVRVLVINRQQMQDIVALEAIAQSIYQEAGKRFRYRIENTRPRQLWLLNGLRRAAGLTPV